MFVQGRAEVGTQHNFRQSTDRFGCPRTMRDVITGIGLSAWVLLALSCKREDSSKTRTQPESPAVAPAPPKPPSLDQAPQRPPCPKSSDKKAAVKLGGASQTPIAVPGGIVWPEGRTIWFLADDSDKPRTITEAEVEKLLPKPDRHLKRRCGEGGCGPHGGNIDLVLVEGSNERVIAKGQSEIGAAKLVGDHVVFATFGAYGASGGVYRAPTSGGQAKKLWDGAITELLVDKTDVYAAGAGGVAWIDLQTDNAVVLDKASSETRAMVLGTDRVVWADVGDPYHGSKPSGRILSAPRHGGALTTHATEQPWPEAITVDDKTIYWSSRDRGGVWSVAIAGGTVTALVPTDDKCGGVMWLRRTPRGLLFLRGDSFEFRFGGGGEMWLMPIESEPETKPRKQR